MFTSLLCRVITDSQRKSLLEFFEIESKPTNKKIETIATQLELEFDTVKNFFTRHRSYVRTTNRAAKCISPVATEASVSPSCEHAIKKELE